MKQFLIAVDQLANTLIPIADDGFGMADESISARAWRLRDKSNAWRWIDRVFFWDKRHCEQSYNSELLRTQLPKGYRST